MVMLYNSTITDALKALAQYSGIETEIQNQNNDITTIESELNEWDSYPESIKEECIGATKADYLISESEIVRMQNGFRQETVWKVIIREY